MTAHGVEVPVPVWVHTSRYDGDLVFVDLEVPSVAIADAPVVVEWREQHRDGSSFLHRYRGWDGRLWTPIWGEKAPSLDLVRSTMEQSLSTHRVMDPFRRMLNAGRLQHPNAVNITFTKNVRRAAGSKELEKALALAPRAGDSILLVDGEMWSASTGPIVESDRVGQIRKFPRFIASDGNHHIGDASRAHLAMSTIEHAQTRRLIEEFYGRVEIDGEMPTVLDPTFPFEDQVARRSIELAVWQFLFETRNMPPGLPGNRQVAQVVRDARDALQCRWPADELIMSPKFHTEVAPHLHGRRMPPVSDLVPILERIAEVAEGRFDAISVHHWRFALARANAERTRELHDDPLATLQL